MKHPSLPPSVKFFLISCLAVFGALRLQAQDSTDLFKMLDTQPASAMNANQTILATSIFKTTRLINGQSVQTLGKGILDVKISHRFGTLNSGGYQLFGLDNATMRMGVDYGLTNRLMIGVGRSTYEKEYDAFGKFRILEQSTGKVHMPISLSYVGSVMMKTLKNADPTIKTHFSDNLSFAHQLLLASKINDFISLQLMPTMIHYNIVSVHTLPNDLYAIGGGGRIRLSKRVNLTAEYYYRLPGYTLPGTYNSFSLGIDIETGGHVFQFHITNSTGMTERTFIEETTGQWSRGDLHFGFNISRVFTVKKPRDVKAAW